MNCILSLCIALSSLSADEEKISVYQNDMFSWGRESVVCQGNKAVAESDYKIVSTALSKDGNSRSWECKNDISTYGVFKGTSTLETALYNMAVDEMINAIEADQTLRTGALWKGVWTRDVSYSTILSLSYMLPHNAMTSLGVKIDRLGRIIQDTGTGGSWPCSSDRVIWAVAAWKLYLSTGDMDWLNKVYPVILKSLESDAQVLYDPQTGLYKGESSFIDWRAQSYPLWMRPVDIYNSECLGTNVVYCEVLNVVSRMATVLGDKKKALEYKRRSEDLADAINKALWMSDEGYYGNYLYGKNSLYLSKRSETLGESLSILWDVADGKKADRIMSDMPVSPWGPTIFWPQIESQFDYHNNAIWPFVTSYWGLAAIKADNSTAFLHAMASNVRLAALYATNYENFTSSTGNPYTTKKNSHNMLWSLSGFIGLYHKAFFGFEFTENGLNFSPYVPKELEGERMLTGFPYRNMKLNITVSGSGNQVKEFVLDGKRQKKAFVPANLEGERNIVIKLGGQTTKASINVCAYTPAPECPEVKLVDGSLVWAPIKNADVYAVLNDNLLVAKVAETSYVLPSNASGEWQVLAVDAAGNEGFTSEPVRVYANEYSVPVNVKIDEKKGMQATVEFEVVEDGLYAIDWCYSNGHYNETSSNKCSTRTLYVDGLEKGVSVFPQIARNDWEKTGWSNSVKVQLKAGKHTVQLQYLDSNTNMNIDVDNAVVRNCRITRIK